MYPEVNFVWEEITNDTLNYSLDGKVEPQIFNTGESDVRICNRMLKPNEGFDLSFKGAKTFGRVPIVFSGTGKKQVTCYFGLEKPISNNCN